MDVFFKLHSSIWHDVCENMESLQNFYKHLYKEVSEIETKTFVTSPSSETQGQIVGARGR